MFSRFKAAGAGVISPPPVTEWEWYFAAQHYDLPTRLLDWTVDPIAAFHFAVRGTRPDDAALEFESQDPPCVWMMDAGSLNYLSYGEDEVAVPDDGGEFTRHWLPGSMHASPTVFQFNGKGYSNELPIAIWPVRNTPRIMAQNGCFTVHGTSTKSIETLFTAAKDEHSTKLLRIDIVDPVRVHDELFALGVTKLRFFPELQNVAGALRREYVP